MRKDGLGDCIIFYPTLTSYRDFYDGEEITLMFPSHFKSLASLLGKDLIDTVIWFDHKAFGSNFFYRRRFMINLKRAGYDIVLYPVYTRETIGFFMMKMTGASERIGFNGDISEHGKRSEQRGTLAYTRLIDVPPRINLEIDRDVFFIETISGRKMSITFPTIDLRKLSDLEATKLMHTHRLTKRNYVVIFPGAGTSAGLDYRIWQHERFAMAVDHIVMQGIRVVFCGSWKEKALIEDIISRMNGNAQRQNLIVNLTGQTDLTTLAHILGNARFYFGTDTGILHLSVAVGTPTVGIIGVGALNRFFPYGDLAKNRAVFDRTKKYVTGRWTGAHLLKSGEIHPSIRNITVEDAKKEIDYMIHYTA